MVTKDSFYDETQPYRFLVFSPGIAGCFSYATEADMQAALPRLQAEFSGRTLYTAKCYSRVTPSRAWSNCGCSYCANQTSSTL